MQTFCAGKKPEDLVFDGITSESVNRFLGKETKELTAKVFRTHHATETVKDYLGNHNKFKPDDPEFAKIYHARMANLEAAVRCNHKRTPPKTWEASLGKKQQRLVELEGKKDSMKTDKQKEKLDLRIKKLKLDVDLQSKTRDYNLGTSLRNYIDPRVYKGWAEKVEFDWKTVYSKTLQRKFLWASRSKAS